LLTLVTLRAMLVQASGAELANVDKQEMQKLRELGTGLLWTLAVAGPAALALEARFLSTRRAEDRRVVV
jgi:hypothetical protein